MHPATYQLRWKNFRAFEDTGWITLAPLTILIGPNNSGKTSITSPLRLLGQTVASSDGVTPLVTRGDLIDAGSYKDIVHQHDLAKELFFGIRYHIHESKEPPNNRRLGKIGKYPPGAAEFTFSGSEAPLGMKLKKFELYDLYKRPFLGLTLKGNEYSFQADAIENLSDKELKAIQATRPVNFLFSPAATLQRLARLATSGEEKKPVDDISELDKLSRGFQRYLSALSIATEELRKIFLTMSYIGPLRDHPKRYYEISGEIPHSVGSRGEHMAALLMNRKSSLTKEIDKWVQKFEFGQRLKIESLTDALFTLSFENGPHGASANIADVGFGASQVLPLVVQALTADPNSLTIAEQPEIHLNPRLQYLLADLFVEMANTEHRVIVETHSEHLLLRLRRLIAEKVIQSDKIAIYFVERIDGKSTVRQIPLEANGNIPSDQWPQGFFEDTLKESLALASAQSQNRANHVSKNQKRQGK